MEIWNLVSKDYLVYTDDWKSAESSVRAKTFGKMVDLAEGIVEHYKSDLWHDAIWIEKHLNGPMQFEWIPRESGTHIGVSLKDFDWKDWAGATMYRFEIVNEDGRFTLYTYHAVEHAGAVEEQATEEEFELDEAFRPYFETKVPEEYWDKLDKLSREADGIEEIEDCGDDSACDEPRCPSYRKYEDSSDGTFTEDDQGNWHLVDDPLKEIIGALFEPNNPTSRNIDNGATAPRKDRNQMIDDILATLQEKLDELNDARQEAEDGKDRLEEFLNDTEDAVDKFEEAVRVIENLDLPEYDVYVNIDISVQS